MSGFVAISQVGFRNGNSHDESLVRLIRASSSNGVQPESLKTLITLTALAHGVFPVVSVSVYEGVLDELAALKLIHRTGRDGVELV